MATRASWLGGFIFGMVAARASAWSCSSPAGRLLTGDQPAQGLIATGWVYSPLGATLFAAAAAWYRRFLNLANPNRGRKPAEDAAQGPRQHQAELALPPSRRPSAQPAHAGLPDLPHARAVTTGRRPCPRPRPAA